MKTFRIIRLSCLIIGLGLFILGCPSDDLRRSAEEAKQALANLQNGMTTATQNLIVASDKLDPIAIKEIFREYLASQKTVGDLNALNEQLQKKIEAAESYKAANLWRFYIHIDNVETTVLVKVKDDETSRTTTIFEGSTKSAGFETSVLLHKDVCGVGQKVAEAEIRHPDNGHDIGWVEVRLERYNVSNHEWEQVYERKATIYETNRIGIYNFEPMRFTILAGPDGQKEGGI